MSPELIAILAVGVALTGVQLAGLRGLGARIDRVEARIDQRFEQVDRRFEQLEARLARVEHGQAKLEGLLEGLREAITGRRVSGDAA